MEHLYPIDVGLLKKERVCPFSCKCMRGKQQSVHAQCLLETGKTQVSACTCKKNAGACSLHTENPLSSEKGLHSFKKKHGYTNQRRPNSQKPPMELCCRFSPSKCTNLWCMTYRLLPAYLLLWAWRGTGLAKANYDNIRLCFRLRYGFTFI